MAWKDLQARFRGLFRGRAEISSRGPDGVTNCYQPVVRRDMREEELAREKAAAYYAAQPQPAYAHTGFTGMNPPMTGMSPVQSTMSGDPYGYGRQQAAQQEYRMELAARQAGQNPQTAPRQQGPQIPQIPQMAQMPPQNQPPYSPQGWEQNPRGQAAAPRVERNEPAGLGSGNFGTGAFAPAYTPDAGSSYTHVEHIMAITSLQTCYDAIECMKNGETLIVTLDVLGSEGESMRCQDMLAGAAFTLQCTVRTLGGVGVVVITPPGVKILPEARMQRFDAQERENIPPRAAVQNSEYAPARPRRVSQNTFGWDSAGQPGRQGINPYTGDLPAAAGAYGAYGGY